MPEGTQNVPLRPLEPGRPTPSRPPEAAPGARPPEKPFSQVLREALGEVNRMQLDAERAVEDLMAGRRDDVARVMLAVQKADLAFETMMQIRNKLLEAYQEIMRMRT